MNFETKYKSRKLAVILAALFMVCCSFAVMADDSDAASDNGKADFSVLVPYLDRIDVGTPAEAVTVTIDSTSTIADSYNGEVIKVTSGTDLKGIKNVAFSNCTVIFDGSFTVSASDSYTGVMSAAFSGLTKVYINTELGYVKVIDSASTTDHVDITIMPGFKYDFEAGRADTADGDATFTLDNGSISMALGASKDQTNGDIFVLNGVILVDGLTLNGVACSKQMMFKIDAITKTLTAIDGSNVTEVSSNDNSVIASKDVVTGAETLEMTTSNAKIEFSKEVIEGLSVTDDVKVTVDDSKASLNDKQKEAVGDNPVVNISMTGVASTNFSGYVTVSFAYTAPASQVGPVVVYFVDSDGNLVKMDNCSYDGKMVTFTTNHFSTFMITFTGDSEESSSNYTWFAVAFAIAVVVLVVAVVMNFKKSDEE